VSESAVWVQKESTSLISRCTAFSVYMCERLMPDLYVFAVILTVIWIADPAIPFYGGLMGIMTGTGLAGVLAKAFIRFSTTHTLPFWTYLTSLIITLFDPAAEATGPCKAHSPFPPHAIFMPLMRERPWQ